MQVTIEVRWAPSQDHPLGAHPGLAGPVMETFTRDRLHEPADRLTLADGAEVEVFDISTRLVETRITQTLYVLPL